MTRFDCDLCGKEFNTTSGRFLLDGRKYCWRCQLKDLHKGNCRDSETGAERNLIHNRWEILDLRGY